MIKEYLREKVEELHSSEADPDAVLNRKAKQILGKLEYDLPNLKDPSDISDSHERFKYMFPLYRMDIMMFEIKLNALLYSDKS